jgi:uncharacterized membrane protein YkoI
MEQQSKVRIRAAIGALLVAVAAGTIPGAAPADDDHAKGRIRSDKAAEQDIARRAVKQGKILPLAEILERLKDQLGGRIIETELENEGGRYLYEIKVITSAGVVLEYEVDATTAAILETKKK